MNFNYLKLSGVGVVLALAGAWLGAAPGNGPSTPPQATTGFAEHVRPFIQQHCLSCHGPEKAKAGFRIDQLSADLSAPKAAEQWKEVIDRINAGEMPPKAKPRPGAQESAAVVAWVDRQLRDIDLAAKN